MNAAIQRRSTLRKATVSDDVVEGLTVPARSAPTDSGATGGPPRESIETPSTPTPVAPAAAVAAPRRGPGRPRSRKRMEPFSSKIEIGLRDQVDAYVDRYGESYVDLLDRALRTVIATPPPDL